MIKRTRTLAVLIIICVLAMVFQKQIYYYTIRPLQLLNKYNNGVYVYCQDSTDYVEDTRVPCGINKYELNLMSSGEVYEKIEDSVIYKHDINFKNLYDYYSVKYHFNEQGKLYKVTDSFIFPNTDFNCNVLSQYELYYLKGIVSNERGGRPALTKMEVTWLDNEGTQKVWSKDSNEGHLLDTLSESGIDEIMGAEGIENDLFINQILRHELTINYLRDYETMTISMIVEAYESNSIRLSIDYINNIILYS